MFCSLEAISSDVVEICSKPSKVEDDHPVHIGQCILQMAKLLLLKFVYYIDDHLIPGSFHLTYSDTDSIGIALSNTNLEAYNAATKLNEKIDALFNKIIKPEKKKSWQATYTNWFVVNESVENQLKPGLLKSKSDQIGPLFTDF